jgi:hypothetical protein
MPEKPAEPGRDDARTLPAEPPVRSDEDYRLLCRRYSRLRSSLPR